MKKKWKKLEKMHGKNINKTSLYENCCRFKHRLLRPYQCKEIYLEIFKKHKAYIPDIVLLELLKYESRLIKKCKVKEDGFRMFTQLLFEELTVIPKFAISSMNWQKAYEICKDADEKDTPFVALSLELDVPLWTNDKKLGEGVKKKGFDRFVTVDEHLKRYVINLKEGKELLIAFYLYK